MGLGLHFSGNSILNLAPRAFVFCFMKARGGKVYVVQIDFAVYADRSLEESNEFSRARKVLM